MRCDELTKLTARYSIPAVFERRFATAGGLISFGWSTAGFVWGGGLAGQESAATLSGVAGKRRTPTLLLI